MTLVQYTAEVRDGLILELPTEAEELHLKPGDKVQVQLARGIDVVSQVKPNEGMLATLREISELQKDMPHTDGSNTHRLIREARSGAMYGYDPSE
jgi:hypothetical protein